MVGASTPYPGGQTGRMGVPSWSPEASEAEYEGVAVPLSEHEQRMLDQLERQLRTEDPRLATQMADTRRDPVPVKRVVLGAVLAVVGLLVILLGVANQLIPVGVLGALVVGAGIFLVTSRPRGRGDAASPSGSRPAPAGASRDRRGGAFMGRLERRWDERRERGD